MIPPDPQCYACGCKPSEVQLGLEVSRRNIELARENEALRTALQKIAKQMTPEEVEEDSGEELDGEAAIEAYEAMVLDARQVLGKIQEVQDRALTSAPEGAKVPE